MVDESKKIAAGIVLYNPDSIEDIIKNIIYVSDQVEQIYVFDNSTSKIDWDFPNKVKYKTENDNKGIAYALNRIMEMADKDGYEWVVTLDQDSVVPIGLFDEYVKNTNLADNIGIICPQVIDNRRAYMELKAGPEKEYVEDCITSGSCTSVAAWKRVGKFDEWLFIDLVDNDFCKRMIVSNYKILRLNNLVLNQKFGKIVPKSSKEQRFWLKLSEYLHNKNIAKFSYKKYVDPLRVYYTNRNIIYVNRKLKKYGPVAYGTNYNCKGYLGFLVSFSLPSLLRAKEKKKVLFAIVEGIFSGIRKKVDLWEPRRGNVGN